MHSYFSNAFNAVDALSALISLQHFSCDIMHMHRINAYMALETCSDWVGTFM